MARDLFQRTVDFVRSECKPYTAAASTLTRNATDAIAGSYEVKVFTYVFGSILEKNFSREKLTAAGGTEKKEKGPEGEKDKEKEAKTDSSQPQTKNRPSIVSGISGPEGEHRKVSKGGRRSTVSSQLSNSLGDILPGNYLQLIRNQFVYAYIWASGSNTAFSYAYKYSTK